MTRLDGWPELLEKYLVEARERKFAWGENDCVLFAAGAVMAMTGVDTVGNVRGRYASNRGALKLIKALAPKGIPAAVGKALGEAEIQPMYARRGDVVIVVDEEGSEAVGIVDIRGSAIVTVGKAGLVYRPLSAAKKAWRV